MGCGGGGGEGRGGMEGHVVAVLVVLIEGAARTREAESHGGRRRRRGKEARGGVPYVPESWTRGESRGAMSTCYADPSSSQLRGASRPC